MIEKFITYLNDKNKPYVIFDIGSRDCKQSIEFYKTFPNAKIYAFECNPNTLNLCEENIIPYQDRITLIKGAVCDYDGSITFYPINQEKTITTWQDGNPGASSLFKSNGTYTHETYVQDEIITNCHRLDTIMNEHNIPCVDIIWMDLQGAELLALKGLGNKLSSVEYVYTEVSHKEMYTDQSLFPEINDYLTIFFPFKILNSSDIVDVIYENKFIKDPIYHGINLSLQQQTFERGKPKEYLLHTIKLFNKYTDGKTILEIGSCRGTMNHSIQEFNPYCCNDGHSTYFFKQYTDAEIFTVDIDPKCKEIIDSDTILNDVNAITECGFKYADNIHYKIDLLYLDAWDVTPGSPYAESHLEIYNKLKDKLSDNCLILIDDTDVGNGGKGKLVIPQLIKDGFLMIFNRRQTLFIRRNFINENIKKFTNIYETQLWGNNNNKFYKGSSGDGSWPKNNTIYMEFLKKFIKENNIKRVTDLGCGDFLCGEQIYTNLDVSYNGYDAYKKMIDYHSSKYSSSLKFKFHHLDFVEDRRKIEAGDLCIIKDVLQHLNNKDIYALLDYLCKSKKFKFILISNCCHQKINNQILDHNNFRPLNSTLLPLKKYYPINLFNYGTKQYILIKPLLITENLFDIVIPVGPNDKSVIEQQIKYTKKNIIGYRNIYLICYDPSITIDGCITINENIFPFNIDTVAEHHGKLERNGWYLQQLLKLYAGKIIPNILDKYLVIDSDTFFLKPTTFVENNKCLYNYGTEYHKPYFHHMEKLDKDLTKIDKSKSGICHHMIFETKYIDELISKIEKNHNELFYNIFLKTVTEKKGSGASEYEIYFNYMLKYNPDKIQIRKLNWGNTCKLDTDCNLDYISYHWYLR